jgi:hypothetical protein
MNVLSALPTPLCPFKDYNSKDYLFDVVKMASHFFVVFFELLLTEYLQFINLEIYMVVILLAN